MSAGRTFTKFATNAAIGFGALFVVGVLLAAIPNHHAPVASSLSAAEAPPQFVAQGEQEQDHANMPGMSMDDAKATEAQAVHDMAHMGSRDMPHMHMTQKRRQAPGDLQKASEIVQELRGGIEKYKDYHAALNDGFRIFLPNVPQAEYHFTNYANGFLEAFSFDAARPTSLLYKKTAAGYELVGAMYTMPRRANEEQLNERVPLSIATWHQHTNLCMPPLGQRLTADYKKFGLNGSIATQEACNAAGGAFHPVVLGWMVHVYPYEDSIEKMFAMHHHGD